MIGKNEEWLLPASLKDLFSLLVPFCLFPLLMTLIPSIAHNFSSFSFFALTFVFSSFAPQGSSLLLMNFATSPHYRPLDTARERMHAGHESLHSITHWLTDRTDGT